MSIYSEATPVSQKGFERGMDRESARTQIKEGGYEDGQNVVLSNPTTGGKHITSLQLDLPLDATAAWPVGVNLIWCSPYTSSRYTPSTSTLLYTTDLLFASDAGQYSKYTQGISSGVTLSTLVTGVSTISNVRRGIQGSNLQINHFVYDLWLGTCDGRNAPMKYGQHFLWNKQLEQTAYMFPLGSRPISPLNGITVGESWAHTGGLNTFITDNLVPLGSRVDVSSLLLYSNAVSGSASTLSFTYPTQVITSTTSNTVTTGSKSFTVVAGLNLIPALPIVVTAAANSAVTMTGTVTSYSGTSLVINVTSVTGSGTYTAWNIQATDVVDYTAPPQPYGGNTFTSSDFVVCSFIGQTFATTTGYVELRFQQDATNYFSFKFFPNTNNAAWITLSQPIGAATVVGTPVWTSIRSIQFINNDAAYAIYVDDLYFLYLNAPPAIQVATSHKTRVVGGGAPVGAVPGEPFLSNLIWSDAGHPDNFPLTTNLQRISGGFESLARTNYISSLREYIDTVIIGTPQAIFSWTIGDTGLPVKSTISTEHGIDSHRGIVETPSGSLVFTWQHGVYILRSTGRQYISAKIEPILFTYNGGVFEDAPQWAMAVVDEKSKTVRICYRAGATDPGTNNAGIIFDYVRSQDQSEPVFPGRFTQVFDFAIPAYVNGIRETIYVKKGSNQIFRVQVQNSGTLQAYVTLPWDSLEHKMFTDQWTGVSIPYASTVPIDVYVRYASNPGEFDAATFTKEDTLPANPDQATIARVLLGGATKYAQVKLQSESVGFEIFPPVTVLAMPLKRPG